MKYLNKITTLGLCFILALGNAFSQEITVRDSKTSSPLSNVYIYITSLKQNLLSQMIKGRLHSQTFRQMKRFIFNFLVILY